MKRLSRLMLVILLVVFVGVVVFLGTWDIPAPVAPVEKVIPNERFP